MNELDKIVIIVLPFLAAMSAFIDNKIMLGTVLILGIGYIFLRRFF